MACVLAVEDEDDLRELLAEDLLAAGYEVVSANDGHDAIEKLGSCTPDIILSDITMPGMDGYELLENVRRFHPQLADTPFLFLTAYSSREDEIRARESGVDDYITKPIDFDVLLSILSSHLRQVARMRERREQQFVRLYNALTAPHCAPGASAGRNAAVQSAPPFSARDGAGAARGARELPVYGAIFRFPNLRGFAEDTGCDYRGLYVRIRDRAAALLKAMLFEDEVVSSSAEGDLCVSYRNAGEDQAQSRTRRLSQTLHDGLLRDQQEKLAQEHSLPPELVANALIVGEALFEIRLSQDTIGDTARFEKAILDIAELTRDNERAPTLLASSIRNEGGDLKPLTLITSNSRALPICFFDFDETSKRKLRASFAFFGAVNRVKAGYLIDALVLHLLEAAVRQLPARDIVVVDVHFETLASETYAPLYARKFLQYAEHSGHALMLNVRFIPPGTSVERIDEIVRPLGKHAARRGVQTRPEAVGEFAAPGLPVACIVVSYSELRLSAAGLELIPKLKPALTQAGTLLILRGIAGRSDIPKLNRLGFDGYALDHSPHG